MSHVSLKYATVSDFLEVLGLSDVQIKGLTEEQRNRYDQWVMEGQNNTEASIADIDTDITIQKDTPAFTFARNAVINWALYKKRAKDGSASRTDAKDDFLSNIEYIRNVITKERGSRVQAVVIKGPSPKNPNILLPSQLDTAFYQSR